MTNETKVDHIDNQGSRLVGLVAIGAMLYSASYGLQEKALAGFLGLDATPAWLTVIAWIIRTVAGVMLAFVAYGLGRAFLKFLNPSLRNAAGLELDVSEKAARMLEELRSTITEAKQMGSTVIDPKEVREIIAGKIDEPLFGKVLSTLESRFAVPLQQQRVLKSMMRVREECRSRLARELEALSNRGSTSLVIGLVITVAGLGLLLYFVLRPATLGAENQLTSFAVNFVPRLTLVIFVEVFAYFFLRLYRLNLAEIKYFQNELTNLEMKFLAIETVRMHGALEPLKDLAIEFAKCERNFILSKDQTTPDIEKAKLDVDDLRAMVSTLGDAVAKIKG